MPHGNSMGQLNDLARTAADPDLELSLKILKLENRLQRERTHACRPRRSLKRACAISTRNSNSLFFSKRLQPWPTRARRSMRRSVLPWKRSVATPTACSATSTWWWAMKSGASCRPRSPVSVTPTGWAVSSHRPDRPSLFRDSASRVEFSQPDRQAGSPTLPKTPASCVLRLD